MIGLGPGYVGDGGDACDHSNLVKLAGLLRLGDKRRCRRTTEKGDEMTPLHAITFRALGQVDAISTEPPIAASNSRKVTFHPDATLDQV